MSGLEGAVSVRCSGGVALSRASAWGPVILSAAIINSTASTWRAAFILRRKRVTSGLNCWSCKSSTAWGHTPCNKFTRVLMAERLTLNARAKRSLLTPLSIARRNI